MPTLTISAVRQQIASGEVDPIYLLQGEDDVEKSALAAEFADLVEEGLRAFNVDRIHAGDWTTEALGSMWTSNRSGPSLNSSPS